MQKKKYCNVRRLTLIAMLAAIASLLMHIEFPLPFMPPFLKLDLSGVPILLAAFMMGPIPAIGVTLIKDLVHLLSTQTGGVGELADLLVMSTFAITAGLIYKRHKTRTGAILGCAAGSLAIMVVGALANQYLIIPFYSKVMPIEAIVAACAAINPAIDSISAYVWYGAAPFNLIKGVVLSLITVLTYKRLSNILKKTMC